MREHGKVLLVLLLCDCIGRHPTQYILFERKWPDCLRCFQRPQDKLTLTLVAARAIEKIGLNVTESLNVISFLVLL